MVNFGLLLEETKVQTFDESFRSSFVDYEELKRVLDRPGVTSVAFERSLDGEIEKAALFACGRIGEVAEVLRRGGDVAAAKKAMCSLLATLRFVELNLVAVRKIVKKRDKFAARGGFVAHGDSSMDSSGRQMALTPERTPQTPLYGYGSYDESRRRPHTQRGGNWLLCPDRSRHLECLESFEPQFAALLVSARAVRESRVFGGSRGVPALNVREASPAAAKKQLPSSSVGGSSRTTNRVSPSEVVPVPGAPPATPSRREATPTKAVSMMGALIATGDAADARALAELLDSCESALADAAAARKDLRHHAAAMTAVGLDADVAYAKSLSKPLSPQSLFTTTTTSSEPSLLARTLANLQRSGAHHFPATYGAIITPGRGRRRRHRQRYSRFPPDEEDDDLETPEDAVLLAKAASRRAALYAQCSAAALYAASCYAIAPTADVYAASVGQPACFAGFLLAAAPMASLAARVVAADASRRYPNLGFKPPVILGGALCCAGNLLYCLGPRLYSSTKNSGIVAPLVARFAIGFSGGADAVNRRYIGTHPDLPPSDRGVAAARYVASDAIGIAVGFFLAALCRGTTAPSLVLAAFWAVHAVLVAVAWREDLPTMTESLLDTSSDGRRVPKYGGTSENSFSRVTSSRSSSGHNRRPKVTPYRAALGRLVVSGVVQELLLVTSARFAGMAFLWSPRASGATLCALRLSSFPTTSRIQATLETVDERIIAVAGASVALVAVVSLMAWPYLLDPAKTQREAVGLWLTASVTAFAGAEAINVADQHLVGKLGDSESQTAPQRTNVLARITADLLFAASCTRNSLTSTTLATWSGPSAALALAAVSTFPCVIWPDLSYY